MAGLASITLVTGLAVVGLPASATTPEGEPATDKAAVEQEVLDQLSAEGTATFWVYLRERADTSAAADMANRAEQGWFVYETLTETAEESQAGLVELLKDADVAYESFWIANTIKVTGGDSELLDRIAARPEVEQITGDRVYEIPEPEPAGEEPGINAVEWNIDRVKAPQVWDTFDVTGEDIVVGAIDTGAQFNHPALVNQYRGNNGDGTFDHNYNWWDPSNVCGNPSLVPCDNNNHGTHVTGTMVGDDGGDNQIGMAPGAKWIMAKGCESSNCSQSALLSSGQFILAPTNLQGQSANPELRPHIVNNSWGGGADTDPWYRPTVQAWVDAGIFPQFASGNPGSACGAAGNPGNLPESYAAGAFDINDNLYVNSGRGPSAWGNDIIKPNITAPGVAVRSSVAGNGYASFTGTSMASPHVAGSVALMWSAAPSLVRDIDATRAILDQTAEDTENLACGGTPENNNVWGQGKLDAFLAVEDSPRGPTGLLDGTVSDADTDNPIAGATVTITGEIDRVRMTDSDGGYGITLPVGGYDLTASAFGYQSTTEQVTITENQTTTQDFDLVPVDNVTVSGTVTDGSGHGWPLYAKVVAEGTPVSTYTDPLTGEYSLELPADNTFTLAVTSEYPGYAGNTQTVELGDSDVTVDVSLIAERCEQAPGYEFGAKIAVMSDPSADPITGFLAGQGIPATKVSWGDDISPYDVIVINGAPAAEGGGDPGQQAFLQFLADTDAAGTGVVFLDQWSTAGRGNGVWLLWQHLGNPSTRGTGFSSSIPYLYYEVVQEHPVLEGFEVGDEVVFDSVSGSKDFAWFGGYEGEGRQVIANAGRADTGVVGQGIGVQERENNRHVLLSMHGSTPFNGPRFWHQDGKQVFLNSLEWAAGEDVPFECQLVEGGLVLGQVTDANTGDGLNGATVTSEANPDDSATSFATPDDPAIGDGFYWLFSSLTGSQQFTASARNYTDDTQAVNVTADATTAADFTLGAGLLTVDPAEVEATVRLGQSANRTFTVTNTGTAPAEVEFGERASSFEILGGSDASTGTEVRNVEGYFSPAAEPASGVAAQETGQEAAEPGPAAPPWETVTNYPLSVMDNTAVALDGLVYSFGGYNGTTRLANSYVYDPEAGSWSRIADMPAERMKPKAVAIDGLIYVLGGWDNAGTTHATVFVYDPATDSWDRVADMPGGRTAPGAAVVDGMLYVVGGCTTSASCSPIPRTVYRYDPGSDAWDTVADYPQTSAWLGCGGLDGQLICAGGTDGSTASTATFAYNPGANTWTQLASMPYDNWAMAAEAASGELVVSGGVTAGFATVTNRSAAYDPASDSWREIEPSNTTVYRSGGACGFYKVGGSSGGFTPTSGVEVHPDFGDCADGVDVPWLSVDPLTATVAPGQSVRVTVSMDSGATEEGQPGTYFSGVSIRHNTPYPVDAVGVTMNVTPPNNWGKITGTVTGVTCQGSEAPLAGATVQINGSNQQVTLSTAADGSYTRWLPVANNPLTLIVARNGYLPQTRDSQLVPRKTVTEDFALQAICLRGGEQAT
jgi:subtilisin family serine protease/N-acetylneuraminic acid mutarotase